ncbi:MAG: UbiA family prenyltransferase [Halodesulfurarchaeum sp.]|nr:UbiA family prenyltransferase [Halodesulfurarchaeum sp.]
MVVVTAMALSQPPLSPGLGFFLAPLLVYFVYVEERRVVEPEDVYNHPYRTTLVRRYQRELLVTGLLALLGYETLLGWLVARNPSAGLWYIAAGQLPLVVLGLYNRLKRQPTFDSVAVGATWAFVIVFTVVISTGQRLDQVLLFPFLAWLLITGAGVESRNIKDRFGDSQANKNTLAGYLGWKLGTIVVTAVKSTGVLIFYVTSGLVPATLTVGILGLLRAFRTLTEREAKRVNG